MWAQTNCYTDLWIEVLHSLGLDPVPALACAFSSRFDGTQWTFLKLKAEDIYALYGIEVAEMNVWRAPLIHVEDNLAVGCCRRLKWTDTGFPTLLERVITRGTPRRRSCQSDRSRCRRARVLSQQRVLLAARRRFLRRLRSRSILTSFVRALCRTDQVESGSRDQRRKHRRSGSAECSGSSGG